MKPSPIGSLDALRGILALVVLVAHTSQVFFGPTEALGLAARAAVLWFFCLSGFVIAMSLHANQRRGFDLGEFALSRFARIVPPLLAVIVLTFALQLALEAFGASEAKGVRTRFATDVPAQLLALVSLCTRGDLTGKWLNGPLWSLVFEIQCYVLAGLAAAVAFAPRGRLLAMLCLYLYWDRAGGFGFTYAPTLRGVCLLSFGFGAAAFALRGASTRALAAVALSALAACGLMRPASWGAIDVDATPWLRLQCVLALALAMGVVLISRLRAPTALACVGRFSYTLYIGHFPLLLFCFFALNAAGLNHPAWAVASGLLTLGALVWLASLVERPKEHRALIGSILTPSAGRQGRLGELRQRMLRALHLARKRFGAAWSTRLRRLRLLG